MPTGVGMGAGTGAAEDSPRPSPLDSRRYRWPSMSFPWSSTFC